jgi:hypothetical protein
MDDLQFGALVEQLNRIATALEQHNAMVFASQPDRPAPNLQRKLEDYAGFEWDTIGAHVEAFDRHGATEVTWNGRIFKRYRSTEDDDKGQDIRFRRVVSGTVAEKNLKWETLIKFGGNRKPAKPLRGEIAEKIEHKQGVPVGQNVPVGQSSTPLNPPVATLGERMAAQQPAKPQPQTRIEIPADLRKDWLYWHDQAAKFGPVPAELGIYDVDTISSVNDKISRLTKLVEAGAASAVQSMLDDLAMALVDAKTAGVEVPAEFYETAGAPVELLEMRIGTVRNLITAKQGEQVMTQPATQQTQITGIAGQDVINRLVDAAAKSASRVMSNSMSFDTVSALEYIAGSEAMRQAFCGRVFGQPKFSEMGPGQKYALFNWLKPARVSGKAQPTNPKAASEFAAVMQMQLRPELVEGEVTA